MAICLLFLSLLGSILTNYFFLIEVSISSSCQMFLHKVKCLFSSVQSLSHARLFAAPWTAACQASLSITNFQSLLKLMSIELVMLSNHLILCHPLQMHNKGLQPYVHMYPFSFKLPSYPGCHITLNRLPCAIQQVFVSYPF